MDFTQKILRTAERTWSIEKCQMGDVALALRELHSSLGPEEKTQFIAAVVSLLERRDPRVFDELCWLCDMLTIEEATPVLMEMLRDKEFASKHGVEVAVALSRQGARQAAALLMSIVHERLNSPSLRKRRNRLTHPCLIALARGTPIAVAPYLRMAFEDDMRNGFKSWPAGPEFYWGGTTLQMLMVEIVSEFGADGVELIKDVFRGTPAQWEAYLREALSETVRALVEPGPGGISPPPVSEETVQRLREYMELLSPTTNYVTPALPPSDYDGELVEPSGIPGAHRCAGVPMDGNAERCGFRSIVACSQSDYRSQNEGATAMRRNVHVIKHLQGWAVVLEGNERPSYTTRTKCEAIAVGRALAAHGQSELIIYDEDGRILQQDSYCRDARPPQDEGGL